MLQCSVELSEFNQMSTFRCIRAFTVRDTVSRDLKLWQIKITCVWQVIVITWMSFLFTDAKITPATILWRKQSPPVVPFTMFLFITKLGSLWNFKTLPDPFATVLINVKLLRHTFFVVFCRKSHFVNPILTLFFYGRLSQSNILKNVCVLTLYMSP